MGRNRIVRIAACAALWILAAIAARAQEPESRRIDTMPKLEIRPPADDASGGNADRPGGLPPDDGSPVGRPDRDRRLQLELDQKERRDALPGGERPGQDYLAVGVIVAGCGLILLLVGVWVSRRRNR